MENNEEQKEEVIVPSGQEPLIVFPIALSEAAADTGKRYSILESNLSALAQLLRAKNSVGGKLTFPDEFIYLVNRLPNKALQNGETFDKDKVRYTFVAQDSLWKCSYLDKQVIDLRDFTFLNDWCGYEVADFSKAFERCTQLEYGPTSLPNPSIPVNLSDMFALCQGLKTVCKLPDNTTNMDRTFKDCYGITKTLNIPAKVLTMQECFQSCANLTTINGHIPDGVQDLTRTFNGCGKLTGNIYIDCLNIQPKIEEMFLGTSAKINLIGNNTTILKKMAKTSVIPNITVNGKKV